MEESVEEIFKNHSIDEIRRICAGIRNDVENKKVELRFLVGERHRDIIEASDNILLMKQHSAEIIHRMYKLGEMCKPIAPKVIATNAGKQTHLQSYQSQKKSVAAQLKLLLDIPELIWSALDEFEYTQAVLFFFLGRHLSVKLQLSGEMLSVHMNARVLLKRQWAALDHVETTIAAACRTQISLPFIEEDRLLCAVVALIILEEQTTENSLQDFLAGRTASINRSLGGGAYCTTGVPETLSLSIRRRFGLVGKLLLNTLNSIAELYMPLNSSAGRDDCQFRVHLKKIASWCPKETSWFVGEALFENLPENVANFRIHTRKSTLSRKTFSNDSPMLDNLECIDRGVSAQPIDPKELVNTVSEWWQRTLLDCHHCLSDALQYTTDLSNLVEIRKNTFHAIGVPHSDPIYAKLFAVESSPLGRSVDLYSELFQPIFLKRLRELLNEHLNQIYTEWEEAVFSMAASLGNASEGSHEQLDEFVWSSMHSQSFVLSSVLENERGVLTPAAPASFNLSAYLDQASGELYMGFIFFTCLTGRPDLLLKHAPTTVECTEKLPSKPGCLPTHLIWRLQRLIDSSRAAYIGLVVRDGEASEYGYRSAIDSPSGNAKQCLDACLRLFTPDLKRICARFNRSLCDTVGLITSSVLLDEIHSWKCVQEVTVTLINRCQSMAQRILASGSTMADGKGTFGPKGTLFIARACLAILDACPGLGGVIVSANGLLAATSEIDSTKSLVVWADVTRLRQFWFEASQLARETAEKLSLFAHVQSSVLCPTVISYADNFLASVQNVPERVAGSRFSIDWDANVDLLHLLLNGCSSDESLIGITSDWMEIQLKAEDLPADNITDSGAVARLKIPSQPTLTLHQALLTISNNLAVLSARLLPSGNLNDALSLLLAKALLDAYSKIVDGLTLHNAHMPTLTLGNSTMPSAAASVNRLTQPCALQLIFDIRFLLRLLVWPLITSNQVKHISQQDGDCPIEHIQPPNPADLSDRGQALLARLEQSVDPFDLEICASRLSSNISHSIYNCSALYGGLAPRAPQILGDEPPKETNIQLPFISLCPGGATLDMSNTVGSSISAKRDRRGSVFELLPFSMASVRQHTKEKNFPAEFTGNSTKNEEAKSGLSSSYSELHATVMDSLFGHISFT